MCAAVRTVTAIVAGRFNNQVTRSIACYLVPVFCLRIIKAEFVILVVADVSVTIPHPCGTVPAPTIGIAIRVIRHKRSIGTGISHLRFIIIPVVGIQIGGRSHSFCRSLNTRSNQGSANVRRMIMCGSYTINLIDPVAKLLMRWPYSTSVPFVYGHSSSVKTKAQSCSRMHLVGGNGFGRIGVLGLVITRHAILINVHQLKKCTLGVNKYRNVILFGILNSSLLLLFKLRLLLF